MPTADHDAVNSPVMSLRERKKEKTRAAIKHHAYQLFLAQGYDATTVDQIAAACEISSKTFFRYFPTKESVLIDEVYPNLLVDAFAAQPADVPLVQAMRNAVHLSFGPIDDDTLADMRTRNKLIMAAPELRGAMFHNVTELMHRLTEVTAQRLGTSRTRIEPATFAWTVFGALNATSAVWLQTPGQSFVALMDEAFDFLEGVSTR